MTEKVKLPRFMCDWLDNEIKQATMRLNVAQPFTTIAAMLNESNKNTFDSALGCWINLSTNQWKLIDALRYGYEPEPEQLYYVIMPIDRTHCFLNQNEDDGEVFFDEKDAVMRIKVKFTMPEILAIDPRYKAFAVKVEEVDGYEAKNCD